jgi:phosphomevalonate kinase
MDSSAYKEKYREAMVKWSEAVRETDPDIFLRMAIEQINAKHVPVWILTDARRPTDLKFFTDDRFSSSTVFRVRIKASDETRAARGWIFTPGIDDKATECGLDDHSDWELIIDNNNQTRDQLLEILSHIIKVANSVV